ncbi:MAG: pyruvate kinase [Bradymonadia bacterium]
MADMVPAAQRIYNEPPHPWGNALRKTKIIATVGPRTRSPEMLQGLFDAGCNVIRLNMSHAQHSDSAAIIADARTLSDRVGILIDTKGPEIRTTEVEKPFTLNRGEKVIVRGEEGVTTPDLIRVTYAGMARIMDEGSMILLDDGRIELEVDAVGPGELQCTVVRGGPLSSRKGVNVPNVNVKLPFMSEKDESDIVFAVRQQADFIAASFVSDSEDVLKVKEIVEREGGRCKIISKIESRLALKNLAEIIQASDGIMIARGDLGVEIRAEEVPIVQKRIINACRQAGKLVIVATQMLESMTYNPRPSRAETSDVANAIFEGADAVMLSGETTVGEYPLDAVRTMSTIAGYAEREKARHDEPVNLGKAHHVSDLICKSASLAARELNIKAILVPTSSGNTAIRMSRYRPTVPILATTPEMAVARSLALNFGVYALPTRHFGRVESMVRRSCQLMVDEGLLEREDVIAVVAGVPVGRSGSTNLLTIQPVASLLGKSFGGGGG